MVLHFLPLPAHFRTIGFVIPCVHAIPNLPSRFRIPFEGSLSLSKSAAFYKRQHGKKLLWFRKLSASNADCKMHELASLIKRWTYCLPLEE